MRYKDILLDNMLVEFNDFIIDNNFILSNHKSELSSIEEMDLLESQFDAIISRVNDYSKESVNQSINLVAMATVGQYYSTNIVNSLSEVVKVNKKLNEVINDILFVISLYSPLYNILVDIANRVNYVLIISIVESNSLLGTSNQNREELINMLSTVYQYAGNEMDNALTNEYIPVSKLSSIWPDSNSVLKSLSNPILTMDNHINILNDIYHLYQGLSWLQGYIRDKNDNLANHLHEMFYSFSTVEDILFQLAGNFSISNELANECKFLDINSQRMTD